MMVDVTSMKRKRDTTTPVAFGDLGLWFDPATRTYHRVADAQVSK
jgi:hypothetical protein